MSGWGDLWVGRGKEEAKPLASGPYVSAAERGATPQMVGEKWAAAVVRALIPLAASANSDGRPRHSTSGERGQIPPLKMDADAES